MSDALIAAIAEYRAAATGRYRYGEVGWIDEHQKRERRYAAAINNLLAAALEPEPNEREYLMASYILRKLEELPWPEIKAKAALEQKTIDQIVKMLLREWLKGTR